MTSLPVAAARLAPELLGRLPDGLAGRLGRTAGELARSPLGLRREVVWGQIAAAFPDRPAAWVESLTRAVYRHFGRELGITLAIARHGPSAALARLANPAELRETTRRAGAGGRGFVVVTGHFGNWELLGACGAASGLPVVSAARSHGPGWDRAFGGLRGALGVTCVPERAPRRLAAALRAGAAVGLVADQHAGSVGIRVPFLGRPASTFRGPARLALGLGVPLVFGALVREGEGYRAILEELPRPTGADAEEKLTLRWVERLEAQVRARPEQYYWFHRRWKADGRSPRGAERAGGDPERPGRGRGRRRHGPDGRPGGERRPDPGGEGGA